MSRRGVFRATVAAVSVITATTSCDGCAPPPPPPTSDAAAATIVVVDAVVVPTDPELLTLPRRGMGWYPNVEADDDGRLHLAWVDADAGDVRYAFTAPGGSSLEGPVVVVDAVGAVGSFLRLALGPGGAPLLSYARQDTGIFRFAWRPQDRPVMRAAGGAVDEAEFPPLPTQTLTGAPVQLLAGFIGEEVGYGDQVGRGSSLTVDRDGRVAIAYYSADDRLRLARRPADVAAFGVDSAGVFEKRDLDSWARGSIRVVSDTIVLESADGSPGAVVVAYAHDVATDARLRVAVLPPGGRPAMIEDQRGPTVTLDGLTSRLIPRVGNPGIVDVVAHDKTARAVVLRSVDVQTAKWLPNRTRLVEVDGVAVTVARPGGGFFTLARIRGEGLFLYTIDAGAVGDDGAPTAGSVSRVRLETSSLQTDSWLDVVARKDGRPAAVWFSTADAVIKLYAP